MSWQDLAELYKEYVKESIKINFIAFCLEFGIETVIEIIKTLE